MFKSFIDSQANSELEQSIQSSIKAEQKEEKFTMAFMILHKMYVEECYGK